MTPLTRSDWDNLLVSKDVDKRLEQVQAQGLLRQTFPALQTLVGFGGGDTGHKDLWDHVKKVVAQTIPQPHLRWASLFHDVGKPKSFLIRDGKVTFHNHEAVSARIFRHEAEASRLFDRSEVQRIWAIIRNLGYMEGYSSQWTDSAVRRLYTELGGHLDDVFAVARADCTTKHSTKRRRQMQETHALRSRIEALRKLDSIPPALPSGLGLVLMEHLGMGESPELGKILAKLRTMVEAGTLPRGADASVYLQAVAEFRST